MSTPDFNLARANMVDGQLRPNKVSDIKVQARFSAVAREDFVSPSARAIAYLDAPVAQGDIPGREIFSPLVCASLIQALAPQPEDHALVVAGGTGYTTAVLAGLAEKVTLLEEESALLEQAQGNLSAYGNVTLMHGSVTKPKLAAQSFPVILIDAPAGEIPAGILSLLAEGGRLAAVRSGEDGILEAVLITRRGKTLFTETLFETKGTILPAFAAQERFVF